MRQSQNSVDTLSHITGLTNMSVTGKAAYHEIKKFIKLIKLMAE
jgi:hypothetical protein